MKRLFVVVEENRKAKISIALTLAILVMMLAITVGRLWSRQDIAVTDAGASRMTTARPGRSGGTGGDAGPTVDDSVLAFDRACAALIAAASVTSPSTYAEHWLTARKEFRSLLDQTRTASGIRDWSAWFELHQIEGTMIACGITGEELRAQLASLAKSRELRSSVKDERRALCAFGAQLAEAGAEASWTQDVRMAWNAACVQLLSGSAGTLQPGVSGVTPAVHRASPPPSEKGVADKKDGTHAPCDAGTIRANRAAMANRSLSEDGWIDFGRALATCGPETKPWEAVGLSDRAAFLNDVVIPFYNGDVARRELFQKREPALHQRIEKGWSIE